MMANANRSLLRDGHAISVYALKFGDAVAVLLAAIVAHQLRFENAGLLEPARFLYATVAGMLLAVSVFSELGVYRTWRRGQTFAMYGRLLLGWAAVLGTLATLSYMSKTGSEFSRLWFGYWAIIGLVALVLTRLLAGFALAALSRAGIGLRNVVLVGPPKECSLTQQHIAQGPATGFRVIGICDGSLGEPEADANGVRSVGSLDCLAAWLRRHQVHEVWLTWPMRDENRIRETMQALNDTVVNIRWVPDIFAYRLINHGVTELAGMPLLDLSITPISGINRVIKEVEDIVLASLILVLILPLMLVLAIGVKLSSPGPILFRQKRHGWDGREIEVWKFRSMRVHAEHAGTVTQARRDDERVTRFGRFIRRTSLDELPQFFNVLQGRMSIVGPRPHAVEHNDQFKGLIPDYLLRHRVKPGITGWAQVSGLRGETDTIDKMRARVELDLYYIEHWSIWFDLRIILQTALTVPFDRKAY